MGGKITNSFTFLQKILRSFELAIASPFIANAIPSRILPLDPKTKSRNFEPCISVSFSKRSMRLAESSILTFSDLLPIISRREPKYRIPISAKVAKHFDLANGYVFSSLLLTLPPESRKQLRKIIMLPVWTSNGRPDSHWKNLVLQVPLRR